MKKKHILIILCISVFVTILAITTIQTFYYKGNKSPVDWAKHYSNLSIPSDANVLEYENWSNLNGDCGVFVFLQVTQEQMDCLIVEAKNENFIALPIQKKENIRIDIEISKKYKHSSVKGVYYNYAYPHSKCTKIIILDDDENKIIVNYGC